MIQFRVTRVLYGMTFLCGMDIQFSVSAAPDATAPDATAPDATAPTAVVAPKAKSDKADPKRTLGKKRLLYIRVDFDDKPGATITDEQVAEKMQQLDDFYSANSQGRTRIVADMTPVLRMPRLATWYEKNNSKATPVSKTVAADARAAARAAGYDLDSYQWEIVNCRKLVRQGAVAAIAGKGLFLNGMAGIGDIAHELGHNYGLDHACVWETTDGSVIGNGQNKSYKSVFDVMGFHGGTNPQLRHFSAQAKNFLNWLPDQAVKTIVSSGTYRIFAHDMPDAKGLRALKIRYDDERNYWVEFRQLQETNPYLTNGALLYWGYNNKLRTNSLLDMNPGSKAGVSDAPLVIGRTFSDAEGGIHITPVAKGGTTPESLDVVVNIGTSPDNAVPDVRLTASSLTTQPREPIELQAEAGDADSDKLAYFWEFGDSEVSNNSAEVTKSWAQRGTYQVRCTVSDMKGGVTDDMVTVVVR